MMSTQEKLSRMICNKCSHVFNIRDAAVNHRKYCGIEIPEKVCPECGGSFRIIDIPKELDKYLHVNEDDKYYTYTDRRGN